MIADVIKQLPKNWSCVALGDIAITLTGTTPPKNNPSNYGGYIPFVKPPALRDCAIKEAEDSLSEIGAELARVLPINSVLVSCIGNLGKTGINTVPVAFNQQINAAVFPSQIIPRYGFYYLQTVSQILQRLSSATTVAIVNKSKFNTLPFPVAPLPEQHRIVSKLEELFSRLDAGVEALNAIKLQLKRYRQAVLKAAFEGKLTAAWREAHKGQLEPASVLLERIKQERKKSAKYKDFPPQDNSDLSELPEGWGWTRVGDLYAIVGGGTPSTSKPEYWDGDIPWITSADIHGVKEITPRKSVTRAGIDNSATNLVPAGSLIVVTRVGLGKIAITDFPLCFSQDSQALIGNNNLIDPVYSLYYLSKEVQRFKYEHRGTTINGVTKNQLAQLSYALPSLMEQHKIIEEIEHHLSIADEIEKTVDQSLKQSARLRQSILKTAFEGKLVPQDPSDEPAELLLERIKAERAQKQSVSSTTR